MGRIYARQCSDTYFIYTQQNQLVPKNRVKIFKHGLKPPEILQNMSRHNAFPKS